ncbi:MAG: OmpA family protein, partial [Nannocystaceae bacterium]
RPTRNMIEVGTYAGVFAASASHELYDHSLGWDTYRAGAAIGLRAGYYPLSLLGVEIEGGVVPVRTGTDAKATLFSARGHAVVQLPLFSAVPFVTLGGGVLGTTGALGSDVDPALDFGGGVKAYLHRYFGIRVDGRGIVMPAHTREASRTVHGELLFSFVITLNRTYRDADGDGVPDPGQRARREDACPLVAGVKALRGCPDQDRDGLKDSDDACPFEAGPASRNGCPGLIDSDNDGFFDPHQYQIPAGKEDRCPGVAGVAEYNGCPVPDSDEDGIDDLHDECIDDPENINGYEDEDGCPDVIPLPVRKILGTIQGIHFGFLSAALTEDSKPIIARAAKVLAKYPDMHLQIQGHTDSDGDPEFNLDLSRKRAESVRQELIRSGVAEDRLSAIGYGGEQPVESNENESGRAKNRRIEFRLLDKDGQALEVEP